MAKDPAILFYPNDWLGGTMGMTKEEKGAYMDLLVLQFNVGHMTSHMIGQVVGQMWINIQHKFEIDNDGLYFNKRWEEETNKRKSFTDSRKNNIKGINQYSKKRGHMGGHKTSHMEDEDDNINNIDIIQNITIYDFENFWNDYDKKVGDKKNIAKKYGLISEKDRSLIKEHIPKYKESQPEKQFRKNPETYLNQKSWNDEIIYSYGNSNIQTATNGNTSYRKNTAGANAEDKKRSVDRLADCAERILQNIVPENVQ